MKKQKNLILDNNQVKQKIKRIAYQILENNFDEKELLLAGIWLQGYKVAELLKNELEEIANFSIQLLKIELDKESPKQSEIHLDEEEELLRDKVIIIVDDVSNTGRTMAFCLKPFLNNTVKKIETASLVNRSHTTFPISCTYTGYELSTTINNHVEVKITNNNVNVFLS
ncbi:MAG: phosphoribosyltransferase family protein [Cyclobacteriaceae bacterium]|nr:phosphoribosyltransferase family protein [Cyclobacteriaceae bacterium]